MTRLFPSLGWGLAVGGSLFIGALAAARTTLPERTAATVTAFGGGVLLAAVALELVPEADESAGLGLTAVAFLVGSLVYVGADAWLSRRESSEAMRRSGHAAAAGQPMTMMTTMMSSNRGEVARGEAIAAGIFVDGVPESIAIGLTIAQGNVGVALLVGVLVGNLVEAYGAVKPILVGGYTTRFAVGLLGTIALALAAATVLGGTLLAHTSPRLVGAAQALAAGAVLAVVSISVIPYAFGEVSRRVALAAAAGFVGGYLLS